MSRAAVIAAQLVAAVLACGGIAFSFLDRIMKPESAAADTACAVAFIAVIALTIIGLTTTRRALRIAAVVLTLAAGIAPLLVYRVDRYLNEGYAAKFLRSASAIEDAKALERIANRTRDVAARIAANRPYVGADAQDALEFVNEVAYVDLRYLGLPDRSPVMFDLLKRALAAKLIDPNVPVKGPRPVDVNPEPLFLHYYRANIRPHPKARVNPRDWEVFRLLAANGADLSLGAGFPIAEDLAKGLVKDEFGAWRVE